MFQKFVITYQWSTSTNYTSESFLKIYFFIIYIRFFIVVYLLIITFILNSILFSLWWISNDNFLLRLYIQKFNALGRFIVSVSYNNKLNVLYEINVALNVLILYVYWIEHTKLHRAPSDCCLERFNIMCNRFKI